MEHTNASINRAISRIDVKDGDATKRSGKDGWWCWSNNSKRKRWVKASTKKTEVAEADESSP